MGDPKRLRKKYSTPSHPWVKTRIEEENQKKKDFGLKNKKELWRAETTIRKYRHIARSLVGMSTEERTENERVLLNKLKRLGILQESGTLDDVLTLKPEDALERRLQTIVWKKGMSSTIEQARQFITHGHIAYNGRVTTSPGAIVTLGKETTITWANKPIEFQKKEFEIPTDGSKTIRNIDKEALKEGAEPETKAAEEVIETAVKKEDE